MFDDIIYRFVCIDHSCNSIEVYAFAFKYLTPRSFTKPSNPPLNEFFTLDSIIPSFSIGFLTPMQAPVTSFNVPTSMNCSLVIFLQSIPTLPIKPSLHALIPLQDILNQPSQLSLPSSTCSSLPLLIQFFYYLFQPSPILPHEAASVFSSREGFLSRMRRVMKLMYSFSSLFTSRSFCNAITNCGW